MSRAKSKITDGQALARGVVASNAAVWAETYLTTSSGQRFDFSRHRYQIEPMCLDHPKVSVRKATQGGWTEALMDRMLHGLIYGKFRQGVIYLFPTDIKVSEFSQLRWTPLIDANPWAIGRHVRRTNNIHNKRIGRGSLMMRGAQLTRQIGGVDAESVALRADPADVVVYDEKDLMPANAIAKARGRLGHSDLKWQWSLSNPTIPNYGIDIDWLAGDQRHWMIRCGCGKWICMEIESPAVLRRQPDGTVIRACLHCGRELDIDAGQWVAKHPSRSTDHISYWWSQLNSHFVSPREILDAYEHPPQGNLGDVLRLMIGMPYLESQYGLSTADVLLCCTQEPAASWSHVPTAMGVDVGPKWLHVVVGYRLAEDAYRIIACLTVESFDALKTTARAFYVEVSAIDNEPEIREARRYQQTGQGRIWVSDYTESVAPANYNVHTGLVTVNRTEILDDTHYYLVHPGRLLLPTPNAAVNEFAEHCAAMVKVILKDPLTGALRPRYITREEKPDHYRHAFANFLLAARQTSPIMARSSAAEGPDSRGWNLW